MSCYLIRNANLNSSVTVLGRPVQLLIHKTIYSVTIHCIEACRHGQENQLKFKLSVTRGKKGGLSDFKGSVVAGDRQIGLSVSETADLLGFSHAAISKVHRVQSKTTEDMLAAVQWEKMPR